MAKSYYSLGRSLSRAEAIAGWCYLPFYLVLLSAGIQYLAAALHVSLTALTINIIYFSINLLFVLLVFRNFLLQRFFGSGFWNFVQALILGFALYYAGTWAVQALEHLLAGQVTIYNNETVNDLIFDNRYVMLAVSVIFAPVIEETLVRRLWSSEPSARPRESLPTSSPRFFLPSCTTGSILGCTPPCPFSLAAFPIFRRPSRSRGSMKRAAPSGPPSRCTHSSTPCPLVY